MMTLRADTLESLTLCLQCPTCHSVGWCRTSKGQRAVTLHSKRSAPLRAAFGLGYVTGLRDARR